MTKPISGEGGLEGAIAEALKETQYPVEDLESQLATFDAELAEDEGDEAESTAPAETPSTAEASQASEDDSEGQQATEDVPDTYWGTDLTGIPADQRRDIIAHLEQQDGTIRQLQAKLAEPLEVPQSDEEAVEEVTDAHILQAMGIDPDDYTVPDVLKNVLVQQGRNQLALEEQVTRLSQMETGRTLESQWNRELDNLEETYGALPGTREEVLRFALREEIPTPADLYFKLTAPVKREVESLAAKARREAGKRDAGATVKPRSSSAESSPVVPGMSMRDAVKAAAQEAQKETGLSWKTAVRRVLVQKPESSE